MQSMVQTEEIHETQGYVQRIPRDVGTSIHKSGMIHARVLGAGEENVHSRESCVPMIDEINRLTCLTCTRLVCKGNCSRIQKGSEREIDESEETDMPTDFGKETDQR